MVWRLGASYLRRALIGIARPNPVPPQTPEQDRWFADQLQPHEPMLRAWLRSNFPSDVDVDDIVQEALVRVLQVHAEGTVHAPKALLFVTARNLVLMHLRHKAVARVDPLTEIELWGILDESANVTQAVARAEELEALTKAIQSLPTRCRQILTLRKIYGMPQKAVAAELGIAEHTVEVQGAIALRKLGEYFNRHGLARSTS